MKARNILDAIQYGANWLCTRFHRPYCKEWDDYLNYLIDECGVVEEGDCTITFSDHGEKVEVWKENKYYAYDINAILANEMLMSSDHHLER